LKLIVLNYREDLSIRYVNSSQNKRQSNRTIKILFVDSKTPYASMKVSFNKIFDNLWDARHIPDFADQLIDFLPGVGLW